IATQLLAKIGDVPQSDFERTWNGGVGMVAVVAPDRADLAVKSLAARGMKAWVCGELFSGSAPVSVTLEGTYLPRLPTPLIEHR
ncbi:MAG: hypothetical protein NTY21_04915, partial [Actinobacteria bacterium]|nr:hypothetical protein [Actinomycetota bacterium]